MDLKEILATIKPGDGVVVNIPPKKSTEAPSKINATVVRFNDMKTAVVVKNEMGGFHTLPISNIISKIGKEPAAPVPIPAHTEEDKSKFEQAISQAAEQAEPKGPFVFPDDLDKKGPEPENNTDQPVKGSPPEVTGAEPEPKQIPRATDIMEQADQMAQDAEQRIQELKPSGGKKILQQTPPKEGEQAEQKQRRARLTPEQMKEREDKIKTLLAEGKSNAEIARLVDCDPTIVTIVKRGFKKVAAKKSPDQPEEDK